MFQTYWLQRLGLRLTSTLLSEDIFYVIFTSLEKGKFEETGEYGVLYLVTATNQRTASNIQKT